MNSEQPTEIERLKAENKRLKEALQFLLEPEFDYPVARRQALELLQQIGGDACGS